MLNWLKNVFKKPVAPSRPVVYSEEEMQTIDKHIVMHYGQCETVLHEVVSPDIHVDIYSIKPTAEHNYYTLITCGMGARRMNVPEDCGELARAELVIALPPDWKPDGKDEKWWWPARVMKTIARLPINADTWVGWGHTLDFGKDMCKGAAFEGALLVSAASGRDGCEICELPGGEKVHFYQIIPIYRDEMEYKQEHGAEALLEALENVISLVVDVKRPSALDEHAELRHVCMDDGEEHSEKIREEGFQLNELAAYQHMAIFLRWLVEREMLCSEFEKTFSDTVCAVREGRYTGDLRAFIRDEMKGILATGFLNGEGEAFARWYYGEKVDETHYYPCDVDDYALEYFGKDRFCGEMKTEGYLFLPWNEETYQALAQRISAAYDRWKNTR